MIEKHFTTECESDFIDTDSDGCDVVSVHQRKSINRAIIAKCKCIFSSDFFLLIDQMF